ncbi:MAG TPA: hypothetical protein VKE40_03715 [Gemmataceae bacterium]|nr:hypothetical protein [Gemmataceae bacterium]
MTPTPDSWSDADFQAPSNRVGTVDELVSTILIQLARGGAPIEELRLLILTRLHQGRTQREVEDELVGWRLQAGYAVDLVCSTRTAGNYGVVEVSTELVVNGVSAGVWKNPTYEARRRLAARAARRDREARRLAGVGPPGDDAGRADLGFEPEGLPCTRTPGARRGARRRLVIVALITIGVVCAVIALVVGW